MKTKRKKYGKRHYIKGCQTEIKDAIAEVRDQLEYIEELVKELVGYSAKGPDQGK